MKTGLQLCLFLFASLILLRGEARACSCAGSSPPCEAYWEASAVFVGQVVGASNVKVKEGVGESEYQFERRVFRFAVERAFRGVGGAYVDVYTGQGGGDCGYHFKAGERYLVYAYHDEKKGRLSTNICTRTRPASEANEDLQYINGLSQGAPSGGTIFGRVTRYRREAGDDGQDRITPAPLPGARIDIAGGGRTLRVETDADGTFRAAGLPAGEYAVRLDLPETLLAHGPERKVEVADRGCASEWFSVESNGRLSGTIFDAEGRPAARVALRLSAADKGEKYFQGHINYATTDAEGRYSFKGIPPGRYIINMRFDGEETSAKRPFPNVYHPNVRDPARATVVEVGEGEKIEGYDLHLPPIPAERAVEGVAVWPDGSPAANVTVSYTPDDPYLPAGYGVKTDDGGHFSFKVYEGVGLKLYVSVRRADGSWISSPQVVIPASGEAGAVKIVVPRP